MKRCSKTHDGIVAHFQKRCLERIGIILNQRALKSLRAESKLKLLYAQSCTKTHFLLKKEQCNGKQMLQFDVVVIYDSLRHEFVTTCKHDRQQYFAAIGQTWPSTPYSKLWFKKSKFWLTI